MDMQDQPRYEAFEAADKKTFPDGMSARPLVEGTVPRGRPGEPFVDRKSDYFYTGQLTGTQAQGGTQAQSGAQPVGLGGMTGASGASATSAQPAGGTAASAQSGADAAQGLVREGGPDIFPTQVVINEDALKRGQDRYNNFCAMCHGMTGEGDGMIVRRGYQRPPSFIGEQGLQPGRASAAHIFRTITAGQGAMPSYADMLPPEDRWKIVAYIRVLQMSRNRTPTEEERQRLNSTPSAHGGQEH
jgi:mono/diheme cytochrome c family protein